MLAAACSPSSFACTDTPVLASICAMAVPYTFGNFNHQYMLAAGQELSINQYTALYALIGTTYGGTGTTTFKLPDLRGKFMVAADGGATYPTGGTGGKNSVALTSANLPAFSLPLNAATVNLGQVTVTTTLPTLSGTANIAAVAATGTVSNLKLNVVNTSGGAATPSGNYLGKSASSSGNIYSAAAPDASLNPGAISGGTVAVNVPASSAPLVLTWTGDTKSVVGGTATVAGNAVYPGTGVAFDARPPYMALTYYIAATNGLYPSRD
ncbi:microcystin-dependent protein [Duganella sp. Leaf126]|nr:microcystin-dependent protein [Duganella sp. Leaf126]